jgi:plasmid stabilization system protein ParE
MTYRLSRRARRDVLLIWRHIAQDNEPARIASSTG